MKRTLCIVVAGLTALSAGLCQSVGPTSFWSNSTIPSTPQVTGDSAAVTLGLQFFSDVPGSVTAVRFYKGTNNTGTHVGDLWSSSGTKLAEVMFSGESASGWQQASFSTPVSILANTTYVVSYLAPKGSYADTAPYSWSTLSAAPLHVSGAAPGVYAYGSSATFPKAAWNASNYSVDLVFQPSGSTPPPPPPPPPPPTTSTSFWPASAVPSTLQVTDTAAVTLGMQFSTTVAGSVTGVRFYKGTSNTGTHVGDLWSSTGTKLAEVTFAGETASGWQQANFSPPVSIAANTTYVISYLAPKGYYSDTSPYSWSTLAVPPLRVSGSSAGVYTYGASASFPKSTWNSSNYWVDVVFASGSTPPPTTYSISGSVTGSPATLTLSGASSGSTTTDSAGNYTFAGLSSGSYVIAPSQSGYTFAPSTASVTINTASITGIKFAATIVTIPPPPPPQSHSVTLTWVSSTSPNIKGYNLYRSTVSGTGYSKLNASPTTATSYIDNNVVAGQTYFYVATTMDNNGMESSNSTQATAAVPTP